MTKLEFPNRITIEVTNRCNVSCTFCHRQTVEMDLGDITDQLFYKIIDEAAGHLPVALVCFFRGEPLLHERLIEYITYAKKKGIGPIQMASNALLLDDSMQERLIETGIDFVSFSLDTIDEDIYRCTRQMGDLRTSMKHVENFGLKCKERKKKGLFAPTLQVSTIDLAEYSASKEAFINHWKNFVDIVRVYDEHDDKGQLVNPEIRKKLDFIDERRICKKLLTDMIIYWNGQVALCNYDWAGKQKIGNVNNQKLEEIWNSKEYEVIRAMHEKNCFNEILCKDCQHWKSGYTENGFLGCSYSANEE